MKIVFTHFFTFIIQFDMKLLDCTLRDGGYYTSWDFPVSLVSSYYHAMSILPIDIVEIGYIGKPSTTYTGEFYHIKKSQVDNFKKICPHKKLSLMINSKEWIDSQSFDIFKHLLSAISDKIDILRLAVPVSSYKDSIPIYQKVVDHGIECSINIMYSHFLLDDTIDTSGLITSFPECSTFSIVDSYGCMYPHQVSHVIKKIRSIVGSTVEIGFHSHDNMNLAFANTLSAISEGVDVVDATIRGMGRGAGNLKMENLLTYLYEANSDSLDFFSLTSIVETFTTLQTKHKWGSNIAYFISGLTQSPQSEAMKLISKQRYSASSIIKKLTADNNDISNAYLPIHDISHSPFTNVDNVLIIGGGNSVSTFQQYIRMYIEQNKSNLLILFSSARFVNLLARYANNSVLMLAGDEFDKLKYTAADFDKAILSYFLQPEENNYTSLPDDLSKTYKIHNALELPSPQNPLALSLNTAHLLNSRSIYLTGFDGYDRKSTSSMDLHNETQQIINSFMSRHCLSSITNSSYKNLEFTSIFQLLE